MRQKYSRRPDFIRCSQSIETHSIIVAIKNTHTSLFRPLIHTQLFRWKQMRSLGGVIHSWMPQLIHLNRTKQRWSAHTKQVGKKCKKKWLWNIANISLHFDVSCAMYVYESNSLLVDVFQHLNCSLFIINILCDICRFSVVLLFFDISQAVSSRVAFELTQFFMQILSNFLKLQRQHTAHIYLDSIGTNMAFDILTTVHCLAVLSRTVKSTRK